MNLLQLNNTKLSSGFSSKFKIECDALVKEDYDCAAALGSHIVGRFSRVIGVPTGGDPLALAFEPYIDPFSPYVLVVDDVITSGKSMEAIIELHKLAPGVVKTFTIFDRSNFSSVKGCNFNHNSLFMINSSVRNL